jgi:hypothetical protein
MLKTLGSRIFLMKMGRYFLLVLLLGWAGQVATTGQETKQKEVGKAGAIIAKPDLYEPLTEPPCSYCVNQSLKSLVRDDDVVLAWIRGKHNGGAMPLRHFISAPRVVNDTYGLFFYDPDGGYVSAFQKDYGYRFYGWRGGVMVAASRDGTLWSALSGRAIKGPQKGAKLKRVPSLLTTWKHWLMLHPESTAYDLFDGKKYPMAELPEKMSPEALTSIGTVDKRLKKFTPVLGIEGKTEYLAVPLDGLADRNCRMVQVDGREITVFWYGPTKSAVAFYATVDGKKLTFYADGISPETAPFKDKETGTRWSLAGRGIDGKLRGTELEWAPSIACRWYAWSYEYPETKVDKQNKVAGNAQ